MAGAARQICMDPIVPAAAAQHTIEEGVLRDTALLEQESAKAVPPAPAEGLILWDTDCGITFTLMPVDNRSASYLVYLRRHHALMEQVCGTLAAREETGHGDECD